MGLPPGHSSNLTFRGTDGKLDYLAKDSNQMGILTNAAGEYSATDTGRSWSFADYYFLEAMQRYESIVVPEPSSLSALVFCAGAVAFRRCIGAPRSKPTSKPSARAG